MMDRGWQFERFLPAHNNQMSFVNIPRVSGIQ